MKKQLLNVLPFGIGSTKPAHFREMAKVAWQNRDNLSYAWKVLSKGVCDGCALGTAGLRDWTIKGTHLCLTRLNLLRLNTMPAMDSALLADVQALRGRSNELLRELGRLSHPMLRERGATAFVRISWDDAIARIASRIAQSDPSRVAFYLTSRGITNETYYVAQKAARLLGTNNIDNAARLCHSPSTGAMKATIGWSASTCSYRDWYGSDLIVFFGSNPANDQPVAIKYLIEAKRLGTQVAMVNPYREPGMDRYHVPSDLRSAVFGSDIADHWFPVAQGGDIALIYGALKVLFENGWWSRDFCESHVAGVEDLRARALSLDWDKLEHGSGLTRQQMRDFAALLHRSRNGILVWSMGITQHAFGGDAVQMILNLGLVCGYIGRPNTGLVPIRGHSGVQGGAEMGAYATAFPGGKPITQETAHELSHEYGFDVPSQPGLSAAEMVEAAHRGELDVLYCVGGNFLRTLPNPEYVAQAMSRVPLRVHQDIILTDQMLIDGDGDVILLPAKTRYEQDGGGTETTTERRVCFSPEIPRQVGESRAEWMILRDIALAARPDRAHLMKCESGQSIREEIARVIPLYRGIEQLKQTGDAIQYAGARLCDDGNFNTPDGKAHLRAVPLPERRTGQGTFHCGTRRGKQFNTLVYAEFDPLTGAPRNAVFINPDDAAALHLKQGDAVRVTSDHGTFDGSAFLTAIARGNVQVHWPEGNVLIGTGTLDPTGKVPDYNAIVRLERLTK